MEIAKNVKSAMSTESSSTEDAKIHALKEHTKSEKNAYLAQLDAKLAETHLHAIFVLPQPLTSMEPACQNVLQAMS